ncbi:hypothetical protein ANCCAN_24178 [Ancylostoma caninum]|uniref:Uncharacterized protein n=1 Tax=Ancylostoma caninum TaxID=29170 RepID=A0A368FIR2_ANCCA|nr:hypothetical protein ANCCAN_24178 [Ancylostoma caninum]
MLGRAMFGAVVLRKMRWFLPRCQSRYSLFSFRNLCAFYLFKAPLFDDPEAPPDPPGILPGLWEYEVVEFFFANNRDQYIEVEVGPHGHWLCLLFDGIRKPFNSGEELELEISNKFVGNVWHCEFELPLAYLPGSRS